MTKKVNGGMGAKNPIKVTEAKPTTKAWPKPKASVKEPKRAANWEDPAGARLVDRLNAEKANDKSKALLSREAKEEASVARFKATAEKVMDVLNKNATGNLGTTSPGQDKGKPKAKKDDRQTERLAFIKQNSATILKAWDALKGKKSGAALNRVLPKTWSCKWNDEVLMLAGLRQSGEKVVTDAVAADKPVLKDVVVARKSEPKAKVNNNLKAPVVKNGGYTDEG